MTLREVITQGVCKFIQPHEAAETIANHIFKAIEDMEPDDKDIGPLLTNAELQAAIDAAYRMCRTSGANELVHTAAKNHFTELLDTQRRRANLYFMPATNPTENDDG